MQIWLQILLRSFFLFIITIIITRLIGKRGIAHITAFQFTGYIVIGIISALMSLNIITSLAVGFLALGVWVIFTITLDYISLKSKLIHDLVYGKETVLIKHGKIMEENLLNTRFTGEELLRELRFKNAFNLADVEFAVMETTGEVNVMLKSDKKPVTAHDLGKKVAPQAEPQTVILDGNALNEPLASLGLNHQWLKVQLENMGVSIDNVFIGQVDSSGDLYLDLFNDSIEVQQPKVKEMLYANIEKTQADLMTYALETEDGNAKIMYSQNALKLKELMDKLEPYLLR